MNGSVDVARILVENGADVNKMDKIRKSSLMVRIINKHFLSIIPLHIMNNYNACLDYASIAHIANMHCVLCIINN